MDYRRKLLPSPPLLTRGRWDRRSLIGGSGAPDDDGIGEDDDIGDDDGIGDGDGDGATSAAGFPVNGLSTPNMPFDVTAGDANDTAAIKKEKAGGAGDPGHSFERARSQ